jgi:hypothetical protein
MRTWLAASGSPSVCRAAPAFAIWRAEKLLTPTARALPARTSLAISLICAGIDDTLIGV